MSCRKLYEKLPEEMQLMIETNIEAKPEWSYGTRFGSSTRAQGLASMRP